MGNPRMLTAITLGSVIVVAAIIATATDNWLILPIAVLIHFVVSGIVMAFFFKKIDEGDKPDPVTEAHIEAGDVAPTEDNGGLTKSGRRDDQEVVL
jgi:hypothetical protein